MPLAGRAAFVSQSGALGLAMIELATDRSLGISSFASIGNRADITANDLLEYWESDPATDLALLYIESFGDPRRFSHVARRVGRSKPIVAVKSGRTPAGARATSSHTGAMLAASDVTVGRCSARRGDPDQQPRRAARPRFTAREPAAARGRAGGHPHQRRRAGDHVRRRLRGRGP